MKKVVLLVLFLLSVGASVAQVQEKIGIKSVIGAAASENSVNLQLTQTRNGVSGTFTIKSVGILVGLPYMGITDVAETNNPSQNYRADLGFPWGIRYRYSTFADDAFTVSKGYYSDKVSINWQIKNNLNLITEFAIYRSTDITSTNPSWGSPIATVSASARSFDDLTTEGGKLYRYKIVAKGVESVQNVYSSFINGVGYRNPTGVITGNVSFDSGTPVKNVLISASPTGSTLNFGTSLKILGTGTMSVPSFHKNLQDAFTLQAWVKPETNFNNDEIKLYKLVSSANDNLIFKVKLGVINTKNTITLTLEQPNRGDQVITLSDYIPSGEVDNKGDDVLVPITDVNGSFTHFSAVLRNNQYPEFYINGRLISAAYAAKINTILDKNKTPGTTAPTVTFTSTSVNVYLNTSRSGVPQTWRSFDCGGGKTAYLDELRVWETALTAAQIQTDFRRYIKGNESYLHTYLTANEGTGAYAYDLSSTGFDFHGNHADVSRSSSSNITTSPTGLVQTGLLVNLEPGQTTSYPGTGSLWTNIGTGSSTYNATLQNSPVYNASYGGNFSFNGTNQSTSITRPVQDDFTLSAWFRTASTSGSLTGAWTGMGIIDGESPGVVNDYGVTMAQGRLMFGVGGGSGGPDITVTSPNTYNDNNWHHVVCTRVRSTGAMVMYVDGVQVATGTGNTNSLTSTTELKIGRSNENRYFQGNISSINIYSNALTASQVQSNYNYFYARHQEPTPLSTFSTVIPSSTQLGILGVTDEYGNYTISNVPYTGNGNSFTLVPSLGVHKFNPNQQMVYIGAGSTVINNVNFKDISSFRFKGIALYDSRDVFPKTSAAPITGDIKDDEFYNAYVKENLKYPKGEYWAEKNQAGQITRLNRYAPIPVPGAFVNIDNQPAIDANNEPIVTDINGEFTIQVPIGEHAISISKNGHNFLYEGRYPAKTSAVVNGETVITNTYQNFYEDRDEAITFIDTTKVTVIGRVVGGAVEADEVIGFGDTGTKTHTYLDDNRVSRSVNYTSNNNIGQATLTLGHMPAGATSVTPEYRATITTNIQTGEFRKKLLPLNYTLSRNDVVFKNGMNPGNAPLLDQDKTINYTAINSFKTPTFKQGSTTINGAPYQEVLKLTYTAAPQFNVESQSSDTQITAADGKTYTIASDQATPIYSQFGNYQLQIKGVENYYNHDNSVSSPVRSTVAVSGGEIIATNNLALVNSEKTETSTTDPSILIYSFRGGIPNTDAASGYKRSIDLKYRLNGVDHELTGYNREGILLGGVSDGTQSFVTAGPQLPDFVLRDPPGSGSSATIDKGSSFTFSKESSYALNNASETTGTVSLGFTMEVGGSILGPVVKTEVSNDISVGLSMEQSASTGSSVENTYTFNQSISTSDDPNWVGSDADLYIGYSANQIYGTYNKLTATTTNQNNAAPIKVVPLANTTANVIYPKVNTAIYFNEAAEKTFFIYSQRSIITDLIPKYEEIVRKIDDGELIENQGGVLSKSQYLSSINLWKRIILNNELAKYQAFNDKDQLKGSLNSILDGLKNPVTNLLSPEAKNLKNLLNATFFENISIDAGVGGITKSYQVDRISSSSLSYELQIANSVGLALGAEVNDTGFALETSVSNGFGLGQSSSNQGSKTTNVSYTLSDTDDGNLLSVDVINPFDGNGPIFITKGGETSCPNEVAELSHYYKPGHPNAGANPTIVALDDADRVPLSVATVALEVPEIQVLTSSNVAGVFEGRNAEFVLSLRNRSTVNKDATFLLSVDQATNPDNALINIEPNGTFITVPAGETVRYTMTLKKVKADQFNYDSIKVSLQSTCDDNASSSVYVSAGFIPSCSSVSVMSPSNNWLMNINTAYLGTITRPLNIKLGDYNTTFSSFKQINLEYRLKGSPNWTGLKTYYKNQADFNAAVTGGDLNVEMIVGNELNYAWDIAALGLPNGTYEIRARSTCFNGTVYESALVEGIVDLTAPVVFGTPTPTNGILGLGGDISIRFNEPVKLNGTVSLFEFNVQKNQLPQDHQVSLAFNGESNTATINKPYITTGNLSIEFWLKNTSPSGTSTLLSQTGGLKVELINNTMKYTLGGQSITASILNDGNFNHYTLSYNATTPSLSIIENDRTLTATTSPNPITTLSFTNANPIVIGGNTFKGNIHDLRLWNKAITRDESVANMNVALTGNENGILGFWPINEGNGTIANDLARFKHLEILNANWDILPKGEAYDFDGTKLLATKSGTFGNVTISKEMNATVTFWMKTAQTNATILSNGKGDATDFLEANQFRNKWAFNTTASGGLELAAEGSTFAFGTSQVNDNKWHHIALSLTRNGGLSLYIDGNQVGSYSTAAIGGFYSSKLFFGARGQVNATFDAVDRLFVGQLDEVCIWNMAKTAEQIKADMYFEQNPYTTGLLFYTNFNKPEIANSNGPKYYYPSSSPEPYSDYLLSYVPGPPPVPSITPTGLLVNLDPGQSSSYAGTGTVWTNIGSGGATYNASLRNSPVYNATNSGNFSFNGTNQFAEITRPVQDDFTLSAWFKTSSTAGNITNWQHGIGIIDGTIHGTVNDFGVTMGQGKLMFGVGNPDFTITSPNTYNDNNWHNVMATRTKATGAMNMYVDGILVASGTGNTNSLTFPSALRIGNSLVYDFYFPGSMSAVHIYNSTLTATQAQTNFDALKGRFYTQPAAGGSTLGGTISFTAVSPAIKPFRITERIRLNPVINGDEIILVPDISNWASIEGKVANITVSGLNDMHDNPQASPEPWTAFISKNPIKMFVEGQGDIVNLIKTTDLPLTFPITIVNQGGVSKPYSLTVPSWLKLSSTSGVLEPNKSITVTATVDMNLAPGTYNNIITLTGTNTTSSSTNYVNKIQLNLRVLVKEPNLNFNPADFTQSMNIVAKIKVDGIISTDIYDKIYAVGVGASGLELRGKAGLTYDAQLNAYNVFLTVYSNVVSGENISFFIWDASQGNFIEATLDGAADVPFSSDNVIGNFTNPAICANTNVSGQLVSLQPGWTWVSFNVNDPRFASLNNLTAGANLSTSDLIQSNAPAWFDSYQYYSTGSTSNGWSGSISTNGGITTNKMYKFKIVNGAELRLKGIPADLSTWSFSLQAGWNWLPYVANKNIPIGDALANLNPADGDLIKSQSLFAIYSSTARAWKGSLTYLNQTEGYMIKVATAQTLTYPTYLNKINNSLPYINIINQNQLKVDGGNAITIESDKGDVDNAKTTPLSPIYSKCPNTMNAIVQLPKGFNELYFYNDAHELRGNCKTINVDGKELAFITIYGGEKPENLTAYIGSNNRTQETTKTIKFSPDVLLGSIAEPIVIELANQEFKIFPNPFHDELKIVLDRKEKGEAKIIIYSILTGQKFYEKNFNVNAGTTILKIQPDVPSGTYAMSIQIGGKVFLNKIIKD